MININSEFLEAFGVLTALLCLLAVIKWWRLEYTPLHWLFWVAMGLGSLGISAFYYEVNRGQLSMLQLTAISRLLWLFVLLNTSIMAASVLAYRK